METIEQIQREIEKLSSEDYIQLREWFANRDWSIWESQVESDAKAGKLDFLIEEAIEEKKTKSLRTL